MNPTSAHARFEHHEVTPLTFKFIHGHGKRQLKKGRGSPVVVPRLPSVHEINHRRFRNALAVDPNALSEIHQMWGSEQPHPMASLLQNCRHHVTHGALAICACNVNKLEALFRDGPMAAHTCLVALRSAL